MGNQKRKAPEKRGNMPRKALRTEQTGTRADHPDVGTIYRDHPEPQHGPPGYMSFEPMPQAYHHSYSYTHPPGPYYGYPDVMPPPPPVPPPQLQPMPMPMPMPMPLNYLPFNSAQDSFHSYNEHPNPSPHVNINGASDIFPQSPSHDTRGPSLEPQNGTPLSQDGSGNIHAPPVDIAGPSDEAEATGSKSNVDLDDALPRIPFSIRGVIRRAKKDIIKRIRQVDEKIDTLIKASSDAYGHTNDRIAMLDARVLFLESRVIDLEAALRERESKA